MATSGGSSPSPPCGAHSATTSPIRACANSSDATRPIAARRPSQHPPPDAGGACGEPGRLARAGRPEPSRRRRRRTRAERGAGFRYGTPARGIAVQGGRVVGVDLADGERCRPMRWSATPTWRPWPTASSDGTPPGRPTPSPAPDRSLSAVTLCLQARAEGFPLSRHTVFFSGDYAAEFARIRAGHLPDDPTVYVCAQDRSDTPSPSPGPSACSASSTPRPGPSPPRRSRHA